MVALQQLWGREGRGPTAACGAGGHVFGCGGKREGSVVCGGIWITSPQPEDPEDVL